MATTEQQTTVGRSNGRCHCGKCRTVLWSRVYGGTYWIELVDYRWYNGHWVRTWSEIGAVIETRDGTIPQCPTCRWFLRDDGWAVSEQMQLSLEV